MANVKISELNELTEEALNDFIPIVDSSANETKKIATQTLLNMIYPVGSIYMSVNSVNPSTLFGGTWVAWGTGRVPVGVDTSQTEFDTVEETGGEKTHTLTVDEMPSHRHGFEIPKMLYSDVSSGAVLGGDAIVEQTTHYTGYEGGGQAHNNLQPYITCYMWKRTA